MALQGDGKIVAVGITNIHGSHTRDFALARYSLNGSLDTSFSGDGKQTTELAFGEFAEASRGGDPGGRQDRRGRRGL